MMRISGCLIVLNMAIILVLSVMIMIVMVISVTGLVVENVAFFAKVEHLAGLVDDAVSLSDELGKSAIMMSHRLHWMSG